MPFNNPTQMILDVKRLVESERRSEIRLNANGGNSILLICDPMKETEYIKYLTDLLPADNYSIIDLNQCLIEFVTSHKNELDDLYDLLQSTTHEIFKAPSGEESKDLFKEIIIKIKHALQLNQVPVLVNTGALYGTGDT
jgi:hypothetical protein